MAHKICFNQQNAQHSFFSVKEIPWHEVGQIIDAYPTSKEALTFAGLNYTENSLMNCQPALLRHILLQLKIKISLNIIRVRLNSAACMLQMNFLQNR